MTPELDKARTAERKLALPLFIQRMALAAFMAVWAVDKFVNPEHTSSIFARYYFFELPVNFAWLVGIVQMAVVVAFFLGLFKRWSYMILFILHLAGTLTTVKYLVDPYSGEMRVMLFWAGVPVLAAFWLQYALRHFDTITLDDRRKK